MLGAAAQSREVAKAALENEGRPVRTRLCRNVFTDAHEKPKHGNKGPPPDGQVTDVTQQGGSVETGHVQHCVWALKPVSSHTRPRFPGLLVQDAPEELNLIEAERRQGGGGDPGLAGGGEWPPRR